MPPESILAHLAPLLTNQIENVATDAVAHLLLQYPFLADAFREYVSSAGVELPDHLAFKTQARWQDSAIPDFVGIDEEGSYILIVESKFWASLTDHQPVTYIKRLPTDKPAVLLFIAPASRASTLWPEIMSRCNLSAENHPDWKEKTPSQFLAVPLNEKHILAFTSWEAMLEVLHEKAMQIKDEYAAGDIWQLQSLCARMDEDAFKPLSEEELTSPTKKRTHQFKALLDELVTLLVDNGIVTSKGYNAVLRTDYYKRYMTINGIFNWCIEYNETYRKRFPPTVLWLTNTEDSKLTSLLSDVPQKRYSPGKQILIPLEIPTGVEREAVINSLYQQVKDVSLRLTG